MSEISGKMEDERFDGMFLSVAQQSQVYFLVESFK